MTLDKTVLELANTLGIALTDIHAVYAEAIAGIAIIKLIGLTLLCISLIVVFKLTVAWIIKRNLSSDYEHERTRDGLLKFNCGDDVLPLILIMACAATLFTVLTIECASTVARCSYPEYFAIKEMLSILGT